MSLGIVRDSYPSATGPQRVPRCLNIRQLKWKNIGFHFIGEPNAGG